MPWTPTYSVYIEENQDFAPTGEGEEYPTLAKDTSWDGEAESPEAAIDAAKAKWRTEHGEDSPGDALITCTPAPDVCTRCKGRAWIPKYVPSGLLSREGDPLGPADKQSCPRCLGTGKDNPRGAAPRFR